MQKTVRGVPFTSTDEPRFSGDPKGHLRSVRSPQIRDVPLVEIRPAECAVGWIFQETGMILCYGEGAERFSF